MIYVTSDWHGCALKEIKALLKQANFTEQDFCFVLGGVTDGGDNGIALLEWLMEQYNIELLRGGSEQLLLAHEYLFEADPPAPTPAQSALLKKWSEMGALPTITALKAKKAEQREYIFEYLHETALFETVSAGGKDFILTHSGLGNFQKDRRLSEYSETELLWNTPMLTDRYFDEAAVIFGHTPTDTFGAQYAGEILKTDTWTDICTGVPTLLRLDDGAVFYAE